MPRRKKRGGGKGLSQYSRKSKRNRKTKGYKETKSDNFSSLSSLSSDNESTTQYNSKEQAANFSDLVDPETPKSSDVHVTPPPVHVSKSNELRAKKKRISRAAKIAAASVNFSDSESLSEIEDMITCQFE